jgi:hypothetical protein
MIPKVHLCAPEAQRYPVFEKSWTNGQVERQVHRLKLLKRRIPTSCDDLLEAG